MLAIVWAAVEKGGWASVVTSIASLAAMCFIFWLFLRR